MYSFAKRAYWTVKKIYGQTVGTSLFEKKWQRRGIDEIRQGFSNLSHPHRQWLANEIRDIGPFESLLEVGCGYGPNIITLAQNFPKLRLVGSDINPISIREGQSKLRELGIHNAELRVQRADNYSQFRDKSVDVVLTDALLLYFAPDKIQHVIKEMKRISKNALVLVELHAPDDGKDSLGDGFFSQDGWLRDYKKLLLNYFSEAQISMKKIPAELWPQGRWPSHGHLFIVRQSQ